MVSHGFRSALRGEGPERPGGSNLMARGPSPLRVWEALAFESESAGLIGSNLNSLVLETSHQSSIPSPPGGDLQMIMLGGRGQCDHIGGELRRLPSSRRGLVRINLTGRWRSTAFCPEAGLGAPAPDQETSPHRLPSLSSTWQRGSRAFTWRELKNPARQDINDHAEAPQQPRRGCDE